MEQLMIDGNTLTTDMGGNSSGKQIGREVVRMLYEINTPC